MIRRDCTLPDGAPGWILISQVEHARLAAELAQHWGGACVRALQPRDELLWTIEHHDDGWAAWEAAPRVDANTGRPLAFTEMPLADSLAIWTSSIERALDRGSLAAWLVAGHFSRLLSASDSVNQAAAQAWLAEFAHRRADWLVRWQDARPDCTFDIAERALEHLRMFDALSLWFCCAERTKRHSLHTPCGETLELAPQDVGQVNLRPWPLNVDSLQLNVAGQQIAARRYSDEDDLRNEGEPVTLRWTIGRGEETSRKG